MIQIVFSLKYQSQIRRIRPKIYSYIENSILDCLLSSGGKIRQEFHCIIADFNEQTIGFWLDILTILETIQKVTKNTEHEIYGHICIISSYIDDDRLHKLINSIPTCRIQTGIWCTGDVKHSLDSFAVFYSFFNEKTNDNDVKPITLLEVNSIRKNEEAVKQYPLRKKIGKILKQDIEKNTLLMGKNFIGKRDCLHWYCENINGGFMPLTFRFGTWGAGISCFADAYNPSIKLLLKKNNIETGELDELYEIIFRNRIRSEISEYFLQKGGQFIKILINSYIDLANSKNCLPILILENIQSIDSSIQEFFIRVYEEIIKEKKIIVYGTASFQEVPEPWKNIFQGIISCTTERDTLFADFNLNLSLWEISYACKLFSSYFPAYSFMELFKEEGKNSEAIEHSLILLYKNGVIRSIEDPEPEISDFDGNINRLLCERAGFIRNMVTRRLLDWVAKGKINPCFNLLEILYELGTGYSDLLLLESIRQDVINGTYASIEKSIKEDNFRSICGEIRYESILYIYKTLKSLIYEDETSIRETFKMQQPINNSISIYKAQVLTINAIYKLGIHDARTAMDEIKDAMIICQDNKEKIGISQVYRLFSLVNFSNKEISDAIDYLSFAMENTEKTKDYDEMTLVAYYSAAVHFIFGNISKSERLIKQSGQAAIISGRQDWALRSKFLLGRMFFETGLYKEALSVFNSLYESFKNKSNLIQTELLDAWIFRATLYLTERIPKHEEFTNCDGKLFEIEASYLTGDYKKTISLADDFLSMNIANNFYFLEQPDWTSGFAQCEFLLYTKKNFLSRMITVWKCLALCRVDKLHSNDAIHTMQQIMRDERMADIDPNAAFYFFANYRVLNESDSTEVDRNTAISMAFKRLQRRSSRIDDINTRRLFLSKQYWNKTLFATAKEYKLI
ncbi:hypothetical protein FACS1894190_10170 [Spirochaetia bacterium]|nr:hypothetical protein FACS1894190_10170 [Spirochaetia bacterium]